MGLGRSPREALMLPRRLVERTSSGEFELRLSDDEREVLRSVGPQLRQLLDGDLADPSLRRLFPPAYADEPERDREYHALVRDELADRRRAAVDLFVATVDRARISEEELLAWMSSVNDLRLVLGTRLDVSEDLEEIDPEDPDAGLVALYGYLGWLLEHLVSAISA
jgi:hypothetical protein